MKPKFISPLTDEEKTTLTECLLNHKTARLRHRAHWILLSSRGYTINELAALYESDRDTVSYWLNSWESKGIAGLFDEDKDGRPRKLTKDDEAKLLEELKHEPRSIKRLAAIMADKFGKKVSPDTIKRALRRLGHKWKRAKATVWHKPDPQLYNQSCDQLTLLQQMDKTDKLNLFYFDASGFSLTPSIPYCWQPIGKALEIPATRSCRINVIGFMDLDCNLTPYVIDGKVDSEVVISCFDNFMEQFDEGQLTCVVLDNASIHRSAKFRAKALEWRNKGFGLYYLPPYCPELNKIEVLWRFIKYHWLNIKAYLSFENLKTELDSLLSRIGSEYRITFA